MSSSHTKTKIEEYKINMDVLNKALSANPFNAMARLTRAMHYFFQENDKDRVKGAADFLFLFENPVETSITVAPFLNTEAEFKKNLSEVLNILKEKLENYKKEKNYAMSFSVATNYIKLTDKFTALFDEATVKARLSYALYHKLLAQQKCDISIDFDRDLARIIALNHEDFKEKAIKKFSHKPRSLAIGSSLIIPLDIIASAENTRPRSAALKAQGESTDDKQINPAQKFKNMTKPIDDLLVSNEPLTVAMITDMSSIFESFRKYLVAYVLKEASRKEEENILGTLYSYASSKYLEVCAKTKKQSNLEVFAQAVFAFDVARFLRDSLLPDLLINQLYRIVFFTLNNEKENSIAEIENLKRKKWSTFVTNKIITIDEETYFFFVEKFILTDDFINDFTKPYSDYKELKRFSSYVIDLLTIIKQKLGFKREEQLAKINRVMATVLYVHSQACESLGDHQQKIKDLALIKQLNMELLIPLIKEKIKESKLMETSSTSLSTAPKNINSESQTAEKKQQVSDFSIEFMCEKKISLTTKANIGEIDKLAKEVREKIDDSNNKMMNIVSFIIIGNDTEIRLGKLYFDKAYILLETKAESVRVLVRNFVCAGYLAYPNKRQAIKMLEEKLTQYFAAKKYLEALNLGISIASVIYSAMSETFEKDIAELDFLSGSIFESFKNSTYAVQTDANRELESTLLRITKIIAESAFWLKKFDTAIEQYHILLKKTPQDPDVYAKGFESCLLIKDMVRMTEFLRSEQSSQDILSHEEKTDRTAPSIEPKKININEQETLETKRKEKQARAEAEAKRQEKIKEEHAARTQRHAETMAKQKADAEQRKEAKKLKAAAELQKQQAAKKAKEEAEAKRQEEINIAKALEKKQEEARKVKEAEAKEEARKAREAEVKKDEARKVKEAAKKEEAARKEREAAAKKEEERIAREAAQKEEAARIERETAEENAKKACESIAKREKNVEINHEIEIKKTEAQNADQKHDNARKVTASKQETQKIAEVKNNSIITSKKQKKKKFVSDDNSQKKSGQKAQWIAKKNPQVKTVSKETSAVPAEVKSSQPNSHMQINMLLAQFQFKPFKSGEDNSYYNEILQFFNKENWDLTTGLDFITQFVCDFINHSESYKNQILALPCLETENIIDIIASKTVDVFQEFKKNKPELKVKSCEQLNNLFNDIIQKVITHTKETQKWVLGPGILKEWESIYCDLLSDLVPITKKEVNVPPLKEALTETKQIPAVISVPAQHSKKDLPLTADKEQKQISSVNKQSNETIISAEPKLLHSQQQNPPLLPLPSSRQKSKHGHRIPLQEQKAPLLPLSDYEQPYHQTMPAVTAQFTNTYDNNAQRMPYQTTYVPAPTPFNPQYQAQGLPVAPIYTPPYIPATQGPHQQVPQMIPFDNVSYTEPYQPVYQYTAPQPLPNIMTNTPVYIQTYTTSPAIPVQPAIIQQQPIAQLNPAYPYSQPVSNMPTMTTAPTIISYSPIPPVMPSQDNQLLNLIAQQQATIDALMLRMGRVEQQATAPAMPGQQNYYSNATSYQPQMFPSAPQQPGVHGQQMIGQNKQMGPELRK